jgi:hypothetical protein
LHGDSKAFIKILFAQNAVWLISLKAYFRVADRFPRPRKKPCNWWGNNQGDNTMSAVTHDVLVKRSPGKKRSKRMSALRKLRAALARRKLEVMHEEELLQEQIYDVFADTEESK